MLHHYCFPYYADKKMKAHGLGILLRITPLMAELGWELGIFCLPPAERFPGALLWRRYSPSCWGLGGSTQLCLCLELTLPHPAPHQYTDTALGAGGDFADWSWQGRALGWHSCRLMAEGHIFLPFLWIVRALFLWASWQESGWPVVWNWLTLNWGLNWVPWLSDTASSHWDLSATGF